MSGADFLCYVTPAEHLGLPDINDVREGVIAARIAGHAADVAKGLPKAVEWDLEMAKARKNLDWKNRLNLPLTRLKRRLTAIKRIKPITKHVQCAAITVP